MTTDQLALDPEVLERVSLEVRPYFQAALDRTDELRVIETSLRWQSHDMIPSQVQRYEDRQAQLTKQLKRDRRLFRAAEQYVPYNPPPTWYWGFEAPPKSREDAQKWLAQTTGTGAFNYRVFAGLMPPKVQTALREAQESELFDQFLIHAPDPDLYDQVHFPALRLDPFLVGYVRLGESHLKFQQDSNGNHFKAQDGLGFRIEHWGLADDIRYQRD